MVILLPEHKEARTPHTYFLFLWIRNQALTGFIVCALVCHTASGKLSAGTGHSFRDILEGSTSTSTSAIAENICFPGRTGMRASGFPHNTWLHRRQWQGQCVGELTARGKSQSLVASPLIVALCCWLAENHSRERISTCAMEEQERELGTQGNPDPR